MVSTGAKEDWSANCTWIRVLKYDWTEGRQVVWRLEEELDKDAVFHTILYNLYSEYLTN
jgi:hypothetical protein